MCRHNFGALTCESCRSFFRRNANRAQRLIHTYKERELIAKSNDLKQIKYKERSLSQVLTDSSPSDVMSLCRKYGMSDNTTNTAISHISDIIRGSTEDAAILRFDVLRMGVHNIYDFQKTFMNKLNEECSNDMNLIDLL
ncbi:unnamed protein product [Medioppia subpectinata]|uniref:Nuclear receptor domain-containing protein n=1 Tax=Medioppia subpectinata TaxID=1979941 RepID=A0A7R9KSU3_9ACAR|nr:unnamed protein product [Medioppia subpectinata]CAG2108001.1 unnamed protein product [Medioppia subpectinata]